MTQLKMLPGSFWISVKLFHDGLKSLCGFDSCLEIDPELSGPVSPVPSASDRDVWTAGSTWLSRCQLGHPQFLTSPQQKLPLWRLGFLSQGASLWKLPVPAAFAEVPAWTGDRSFGGTRSCARYHKWGVSVCHRTGWRCELRTKHTSRDLAVRKRWGSAILCHDSWTRFTGGLESLGKPYVGWGVPGTAARGPASQVLCRVSHSKHSSASDKLY